MSVWDKALSFFVGNAAGRASSETVSPVFEPLRQNSWARRPYRVLGPLFAARADAQQLTKEQNLASLDGNGNQVSSSHFPESQVDLEDDVIREGYGPARWDLLRRMAREMPTFSEALSMWQRRRIPQDTLDTILARQGIPPALWPAMRALAIDLLSPATVANAVQQGHMPNEGESGRHILPPPIAEKPGIVPPSADGPDYDIPLTQIDIDPEKEVEMGGLDFERLQIEANLAGLPPPQEMLLDMWRRGIITKQAVIAGIREGHTKTKWIPAVLALKRRRLAAQEYANAWLREWISEAEAKEGGRAQGYTADDMELLYKNRGRPAAPGQMWTAWARKVIGPRGVPTNYQDHEEAIRRSNIRPEYAPMLWGIRFYYPPLFQLNRLVQAGAVEIPEALKWAEFNRTAPEVLTALEKYWRGAAGGGKNSWVVKAESQLWSTLHRAFLAHDTDEGDVLSKLTTLGVPEETQIDIVGLWEQERDLNRARLTATQLKKAWKKAVKNPATGVPWTRDEALAELLDRGWNTQDANTFLDTPTAP